MFFPPVTVFVSLSYFLKVQQIQPNVIPDAVKDLTAMFIKSRGPAQLPGAAVESFTFYYGTFFHQTYHRAKTRKHSSQSVRLAQYSMISYFTKPHNLV